jgi:uncharacterized protein (DUF2141 family)
MRDTANPNAVLHRTQLHGWSSRIEFSGFGTARFESANAHYKWGDGPLVTTDKKCLSHYSRLGEAARAHHRWCGVDRGVDARLRRVGAQECPMLAKLSLVFAAVWLATVPSQAATLTVTVLGLRSDAGELLVGVYDSAPGFKSAVADSAKKSALLPEKWRVAGASLRAQAGAQSITFRQLPPGRYAIIAFHDENDNGLLDENAMGVPLEGYGFSNDAQGFLSAPSFAAAAITLPNATDHIDTSISLIYPRVPSSADKEEFEEFMGTSQAPNRE